MIALQSQNTKNDCAAVVLCQHDCRALQSLWTSHLQVTLGRILSPDEEHTDESLEATEGDQESCS